TGFTASTASATTDSAAVGVAVDVCGRNCGNAARTPTCARAAGVEDDARGLTANAAVASTFTSAGSLTEASSETWVSTAGNTVDTICCASVLLYLATRSCRSASLASVAAAGPAMASAIAPHSPASVQDPAGDNF